MTIPQYSPCKVVACCLCIHRKCTSHRPQLPDWDLAITFGGRAVGALLEFFKLHPGCVENLNIVFIQVSAKDKIHAKSGRETTSTHNKPLPAVLSSRTGSAKRAITSNF